MTIFRSLKSIQSIANRPQNDVGETINHNDDLNVIIE